MGTAVMQVDTAERNYKLAKQSPEHQIRLAVLWIGYHEHTKMRYWNSVPQ